MFICVNNIKNAAGSRCRNNDKGVLRPPYPTISSPFSVLTIVLVVIFIVSIKLLVMSYAYEIRGVVRQT
jgi:hypothetical protein